MARSLFLLQSKAQWDASYIKLVQGKGKKIHNGTKISKYFKGVTLENNTLLLFRLDILEGSLLLETCMKNNWKHTKSNRANSMTFRYWLIFKKIILVMVMLLFHNPACHWCSWATDTIPMPSNERVYYSEEHYFVWQFLKLNFWINYEFFWNSSQFCHNEDVNLESVTVRAPL